MSSDFENVSKVRLDSITGLRGFAVFIVFLSHCANKNYLPAWLGQGFGQIGVMIFFTLSGFLMASLYLQRVPDRYNLEIYARSRAGRVLPLFILVVLTSVTLNGLEGWPYGINTLKLFLMNVMFIKGTAELWAVPVEIQFYFIFVGIWVLSHRSVMESCRLYVRLIFSLSIISGLICLVITMRGDFFSGIHVFIQYFLIGLLMPVAIPMIRKALGTLPAGRYRVVVEYGSSILVMFFLVGNAPYLKKSMGIDIFIWWDPLVALAVASVFMMTFFRSGIFRMMESPIFLSMGTISYGFYLIHPIIIGLFSTIMIGSGDNYIISSVIFFISTGIAMISYYLFERPILNKFKTWGKRGTLLPT
ncbi:acyltransferase family protein [Amaricoccus solimangrovi]|uniref:Acyltransferase n=1 Tax=Amaricoccus solimangrovi TaxID=2589815 RepID=A0A501WK21_9RHOB|nr:acyltransferase [Amaricoccus solimangrovi]TPE49122.1 acyltransferase [Amaricoccus solimangrovi]